MILVDLQVPQIAGIFDMEVDEDMTAAAFAHKAAELVAGTENMEYRTEDRMLLFAHNKDNVLEMGKTLREQGILSGEKLYLI